MPLEQRGARLEPRPVRYILYGAIAAAASTGLLVALIGPRRLAAEASISVAIAPPPTPRLPAGFHVILVIAVAIGSFLAALGLYSRRVANLYRALDEYAVTMVMEFLALLRSGYSVTEAISVMAERDYGPLNGFVRRLDTLMRRNYTFEEAFDESVKDLPRHTRVFLVTIRDAYDAGGRAIEFAGSLSSVMASINALEDLRRSSLKGYTYIIAVSIIMLAIVGLATLYLLGALSHAAGSLVRPVFSRDEVAAMLFYISLWVSIFSGLVAGKLITGTVKAGFWHAFLYYLATIAPLLGGWYHLISTTS